MPYFKERYLNPLTDFGFKKLFGNESSKVALIDFLNQLLPKHHQIRELDFVSGEQFSRSAVERFAVFDVYCISESGERFIVEVQKTKQPFFKERALYYATFPIQEQAKKGGWNFELDAVYLIGVVDFIFDDLRHKERYVHRLEWKDEDCDVIID